MVPRKNIPEGLSIFIKWLLLELECIGQKRANTTVDQMSTIRPKSPGVVLNIAAKEFKQ